MFKKIREITDENGVKRMEEYNPIKERIQKIGAKTCEVGAEALEFVADNSTTIQLCISGSLLLLGLGFSKGVEFTNKRILEGWKNNGYQCRGDGMVFKKKMSFSDWMDYLDHGYNTKKGWKNKNINAYLKQKGFID